MEQEYKRLADRYGPPRAVLVEQARDGERTVLFTVAASEPAAPVEAVQIGDRSYRCATT